MKVTKEAGTGIFLFLLPAAILFSIFYIYPVGYVSVLSFFDWNGITGAVFSGLTNYKALLADKYFRISIRNNVIWALTACLVQVPLSLLMAIILSQKIKGWKVFRTIYFLPQVISGIAIASMWSAIYNSEFGLINGFLKLIGREDLARNWLGDPKTALPSVLIYGVFYIGYYMVILMAGISNIDETYFEAARIDGASAMQEAVHITIPLTMTSIRTCLTLAAIYGLRTFEQVYMLTNGGPAHRTSVTVLYLYNEMRKNDYGTANAASVMLILLGVVVITTLRTLFRKGTDAAD